MYTQFFKLRQNPFSIAPDPRFLYMSELHREALAHLLYGVSGGGGFVLLTGEIGAGKTTVCRRFLEQIPGNCNVGYIFNPKLTVEELLRSICDEFHLAIRDEGNSHSGVKRYVDALNAFLLQEYANGRHNVLVIDEAQGLTVEVLEQLRLLTNLETNERKLLQIILIGQPELHTMLEQFELKQLEQRVIARYHLESLSPAETARYVLHRLAVAGIEATLPFPKALMKRIHRLTEGVPRRINLLCDRSLLGAYAEGRQTVNQRIVNKAATEVFGKPKNGGMIGAVRRRYTALGLIAAAALGGVTVFTFSTQLAATAPATRASLRPVTETDETDHPVAQLITPPSFDLDKSPPADTSHADLAYRHLANMWGIALPDGDPCQVLPQSGLRCYQSTKGLSAILLLDRPALLWLHDRANHAYIALLTGLTDTHANLMIGDITYSVKLVELARHFQGDFTTFWKIHPGYREKIRSGDIGADVDWLIAQLAKLRGIPTPMTTHPLDQSTIKKIREFQSAEGLNADGVVGPQTFMQLSRATDNSEPRLQNTLGVVQKTSGK